MATTTTTPAAPTQRRFPVDEPPRMGAGAAGVFGEDNRVERFDGPIYATSPVGSEPAARVDRLTKLFVLRTAKTAIVRVQNPVRLNKASEPDLALLAPRDDVLTVAESPIRRSRSAGM